MSPRFLVSGAVVLALGLAPLASDRVSGQTTRFESPGGVVETCVVLDPMPGAVYTDADHDAERELCAVDLYDPQVAICPKLVSTSPGTFIYGLDAGAYAGAPERFESEVCPRGEVVVEEADGPPVYFKVTMNGQETSATFSTASLLYYHFSRFLNGTVRVPVSVYRSIDRGVHEQRVTRRGLDLSANRSALRMNHAAWQELDAVEKGSEQYVSPDEIFTADRKRVHGVLLRVSGRRYGPEFNGTRRSGWGDGQNQDFQQTAAYLALRHDAPLAAAIDHGLRSARRDDELDRALGATVSATQMAFWMQDLTEIVFLDYLFSQQDRIGNIDYVDTWHWVHDGVLHTRAARGSVPPPDIAGSAPVLLRRTWLNDNDAGGKRMYRNYAKRTGMIEGLRHFNPDTYRRLIGLAADLAAGGEIHSYVRDTFGLTQQQLDQIVTNAGLAAATLQAACRAAQLRFDLDPVGVLTAGAASVSSVDCDVQ